MCGIAGCFGEAEEAVLSGMLRRIRHRGPDDTGMELREGCALGNVRLAIVDLANGRLPMVGHGGELILAYNGEIYGYRDIREKLLREGETLTTTSDAEVLLPLYARRGPACVDDLNGMFAFALYDRSCDRLMIARDHFGIKPVVYTVIRNRLYFASETKAFYAVPGFTPKPDRDAWHAFFNVRFTPSPHTLFEGVWKVPPGCYCVVSRRDVIDDIPQSHRCVKRFVIGDSVARVYRYYELPAPRGEERADPVTIRRLLGEAVRSQLVADVDVGVYLSGGLDSSTVAALAARESKERLRTMCLGFNEPSDENRDAARVAKRLGCDHRDIYLDENPLDHYRRAVYYMEEPKVNCLQGFLLAREARRERKVMLSGVGGDEIFGGYDVYAIGCWLDMLRKSGLDGAAGLAGALCGGMLRLAPTMGLDLARRGADLLRHLGDPLDSWIILRNGWDHDRRLRRLVYARDPLGSEARRVREHFADLFEDRGSFADSFMRLELQSKMVDDFLANEDRMSMAHGLETRVPLLDRTVAEYMMRVPVDDKIAVGRRKISLRRAMKDILPTQVFAKKKHGFTFNPVLQFDKDLGAMARSCLTRGRVAESGLFNYTFIERLLHCRPSERLRWHCFVLWMMVGYHLWEDVFLRGEGRIEP